MINGGSGFAAHAIEGLTWRTTGPFLFSLDEKPGLLKWIEEGSGKSGYSGHNLNF
jgi:hypothetical protein